MNSKSDNDNIAKLYTEGTMSASDKKKAAEVKKMYSADEPMGQAAGLKLKAAANDLDRKYGKDWRKEEDAEGGVVYMVMGEADYEAPDIRGIYSDKEAAVEAAKGLQGQLAPDFDIGVVEIQLNTPLDFDTERKYIEYDSGEVTDPREGGSEFIGTARA